MANREQNQNQTEQQKGRRKPETLPPEDDDALETGQAQQVEQQARRQQNEPDQPLSEIEQDEDLHDEDGMDDEGTDRPS